MNLLRFTTAGSVDDGKSTLIGRLLYDSKSIFDDQFAAVEAVSARRGDDQVNLALLTDGLRAEREQGITIDVAYRYFATPKRKFILADTPGHVQYTRNMVTGASTADVALVLVDARHGVVEQTRRHTAIASLLNLSHIVVCVNKMDLVGWDEAVFHRIADEVRALVARVDGPSVSAIPVSALGGDNVVEKSDASSWYAGPSLLDLLETLDANDGGESAAFRFPVQYVIRPQRDDFPDFRGYAGRIASGRVTVGDQVLALPSGRVSTVDSIVAHETQLTEAGAGRSVTLTLSDDIDISRGELLVFPQGAPEPVSEVVVDLCWLSETPLKMGAFYGLRSGTRDVRAIVAEIVHRVDIETLAPIPAESTTTVAANDIARVRLRLSAPVAFDPYKENRATGSLILIDEARQATAAAAMVIG